ncbi:GntR family transcriptional regulator [Haloactinomyces albus]|uniref:DNA-binding GntR family transcriptional regulator n=1 Tax=Haloactinomyces albus TaxID=1352928 RepID=A0AAE4CQ41_9ACTN|nr:GntR family transcriptional regulator [Haloactinomyces albus]MDR7303762.1 DNA-binding GntR family transcriptional regulator [Haloactinomyces albus]
MRNEQGSEERRGSAQDVTYRWLKGHIAGLPRQEGSFLTEVGVAEAAGTSRTPVREALLRLQAEGVVQIVPKKGAFVPPISDSEVQAVMQARGLVEDWCVRQVTPIVEGLAEDLDRLVTEQEDLSEDPVAFIDCDRAFHRTIVRRAGNQVLADFYESLRERQVRMGLHAVASAEDRVRTVLDEHAAIVSAIRSGEAERAAHAVSAHLASTLATLNLPAIVDWGSHAGGSGPVVAS